MTDKNTNTEAVVPRLSSIYMYASGACNLNCAHCWINPEFQIEGTKTSLHLKLKTVKKAVLQGKPLGLATVKLTGGEPLMNPQIKDIIKFVSDEGVSVIIETNGTLVDKEMARFLKETKKFSFISVSLDGADAPTHEALRQVEGSFDKAVQGIKNLVEVGIRPQMICTLHKNNIHQIRDTIKLAENLKCNSIKFNFVQQVGRGMDFDNTQAFSVPEIIEIDRMLEEEITPTAGISILQDVPIAFQKPTRFLRNSIGRCNIHNIIGLLSNGDLALCGIGTSVEELLYGNINTDGLEDVWRNSPKLSNLRILVPNELEGICSKCIHKNFCKGACVAGNYNRTGKINAPYHFCDTAEKLGLFPTSRKLI